MSKKRKYIRRDPFIVIKKELATMSNTDLNDLAEECDLTPKALQYWKDGRTKSPYWDNIVAVLGKLGYKVEIHNA